MRQNVQAIARFILSIAVGIAALWTVLVILGASQKSYLYAQIGPRAHNVAVAGARTLTTRYAYLLVNAGPDSSGVLVEAKEWDKIMQMFDEAKAHQSSTWHLVGTFTESEVFNPSTLAISAGPAIRLAIMDDGVCARYDLAPSDFENFRKGEMQAKQNFVSEDANTGLKPMTGSLSDAVHNANQTIAASLPKGRWPNCN